MLFRTLIVLSTAAASLGSAATAWVSIWIIVYLSSDHCSSPFQQPFDLTTLSAPDGSITAKFVSFGSTLTELWVKDKKGQLRDIVLGYDDNVRNTFCPFPLFEPTVLLGYAVSPSD